MRPAPGRPQPINQDLLLPELFPELPDGIRSRFPADADDYDARLKTFWTRTRRVLSDSYFDIASPVNEVKMNTRDIIKEFGGFVARIVTIEDAYVDETEARAISNEEISAALIGPGGSIYAAVEFERAARVTAEGFMEAKVTLTATAGNVVTGLNITSFSGPGTNVSEFTIQADRFKVQTATGTHKVVFATSADAILLGNVLTVDLAASKVYIGAGNYNNADTAWYVDNTGRFSLKNRVNWDGTDFGFSTGTGGNSVFINSSGLQVGVGTVGAVYINNNSGNAYLNFRYNGSVFGSWAVLSTYSAAQWSDNAAHSVTVDGRGNPGLSVIGPGGVYGLNVSNDALISGKCDVLGVVKAASFDTF